MCVCMYKRHTELSRACPTPIVIRTHTHTYQSCFYKYLIAHARTRERARLLARAHWVVYELFIVNFAACSTTSGATAAAAASASEKASARAYARVIEGRVEKRLKSFLAHNVLEQSAVVVLVAFTLVFAPTGS